MIVLMGNRDSKDKYSKVIESLGEDVIYYSNIPKVYSNCIEDIPKINHKLLIVSPISFQEYKEALQLGVMTIQSALTVLGRHNYLYKALICYRGDIEEDTALLSLTSNEVNKSKEWIAFTDSTVQDVESVLSPEGYKAFLNTIDKFKIRFGTVVKFPEKDNIKILPYIPSSYLTVEIAKSILNNRRDENVFKSFC